MRQLLVVLLQDLWAGPNKQGVLSSLPRARTRKRGECGSPCFFGICTAAKAGSGGQHGGAEANSHTRGGVDCGS